MKVFILKAQELRNDPTVIEWFEIINSKPNTERNYLLGFHWFTEFTNKEPETLLLEAEREIKDGILPRQRSIKKYLTGFRKHLQDKGNSPNTVNSHITGVKSFYQAFDIEIPKFTRASSKAQSLKKHKQIPNKEDLQEVLRVCDPLEKAILLVGVSSGLSANEIINLTVKDFKKGYDAGTGVTTLDLRREKVDFDFITFLSPEASNAVLDYLSYRARTDKKQELKRIHQLEKQKVFSDSDYLFIKRNISPEFIISRDENLRKHDSASMVKLYRNLSEKARKNTAKWDWNLIRSHNMRKFFNSALLNAGADSFHTEFFMGHTLDETRSAYFRASPEKLKEIYLKYVPYLTITKEVDVSESPEYQRIKNENAILQAETARHIVERKEIEEIRDTLTSLIISIAGTKEKE